MFVMKRNQVIVTALLVMIAVAGYLNFTDSKTSESAKSAISLTEEGDAVTALLPEGDIETLADDVDENMDMAQAGGVETTGTAQLDPVTGEVVAVSSSEEGADDTGAAVFVNSSQDSSTYFVQAKLDREQARAKQKDILTEMINNNSISEEEKAACATNMLDIQKRIEKETAAEAMIESKGFKEAYVRIDDETVDVVVDKSQLSEAEVAQIMDIVKRKTGFPEDKIRISPLKAGK